MGEAPDADGVTAEILKSGGEEMVEWMFMLFIQAINQEVVAED